MLQWVFPFYEIIQVLPPEVFINCLKYHWREVGPFIFTSPAWSSCGSLICPTTWLPHWLTLPCLFVFPSIFFFANSSKTIPCNSWESSVWFGLLFVPPHLFLGSVLIFASAPPRPQYLFCPPLVPRFRLSPTNRDCVTSWLDPSSLG